MSINTSCMIFGCDLLFPFQGQERPNRKITLSIRHLFLYIDFLHYSRFFFLLCPFDYTSMGGFTSFTIKCTTGVPSGETPLLYICLWLNFIFLFDLLLDQVPFFQVRHSSRSGFQDSFLHNFLGCLSGVPTRSRAYTVFYRP